MNTALKLLSVLLFVGTTNLSRAEAPKVAIEAFASLQSFSRARLSPSGTKIAFMTEREGHRSIIILDMKTNESVIIPKFGESEITNFRWANEEVVLLTFGVQDTWAGDQFFTYKNRNFSYNLNTDEFVWLENPRATGRLRDELTSSGYFIHSLPDDKDHILLMKHEGYWLDVYKTNVYTGKKKRIKKGKRGVNSWYTDHAGNIRFGRGYYKLVNSPGVEKETAYIVEDNNSLTDIREAEWLEDYHIEGFSGEPDTIYVSGPSEYGTEGIFSLNIRSGKFLDNIYAHPDYDVGGILTDPDTGNITGVHYTSDITHHIYFDQELSNIQKSLKKALNSDQVYIVSKARHARIYLALTESPTNPGDYYIYNSDDNALNYIAPIRDTIYPEDMASVTKVTYQARDGIAIPAYLTLPQGKTKNLPTIILPHGGPNARDTLNWDFWSQFYANRGYAVIQPNFRGSTGYGKAFNEAGHNQWGGLMQDDVTDATRWMIKEGYSDPNRICIVGASYGGYASLMGIIKEPELYTCAISVNGVTDIPELRRGDKWKTGFKEWLSYMGLEGKPDEYASPYHRADEVSVPVMLISSVDDMRVPYKMSIDMHEKLIGLGKESKYIQLDDGGHSMLTLKARKTLLTETEKFLAEHIGN